MKKMYVQYRAETYETIKIVLKFAFKKAEELSLDLIMLTDKRKSQVLDMNLVKGIIKQIRNYGKHKNVNYSFETLLTYKNLNPKDIIVGLSISLKDYDKLDTIARENFIIATELNNGQLDVWKKRWGAIDIENPERKQEEIILDPVLKTCLDELTSRINVSTGISHKNDEEKAKTYIEVLVEYKIPIDCENIKSYLIKNYWGYDQAEKFVMLLKRKYSGGRIQGSNKTDLQKHYDRWKSNTR